MVQNFKANPDIIFLSPEGKARWIRYPMSISLCARHSEDVTVIFKSSFQVNTPPPSASLHIRALKRASVFLDNRLLFSSHRDLNRWKEEYVIDLSPGLSPGLHELRIEVFNPRGHPALLAYCQPLNVYTGEAWESTYDGQPWGKALPVNTTQVAPISRQFERADHALLSRWWCFLPLFMVVFCYAYLISRGTIPAAYRPTARAVRWFVLAAWVILAANNFFKIPLYVGMDIDGHLRYVQYLILNHRIPLPNEDDIRPPWNYGFMLACSWLSLLPTVAILLGIIYALRKPDRRRGIGLFFAALCVIVYTSAISYVYLTLPVYSTGKATYALGITACFVILCVQGLDLMMRKPVIRFAVYGIVACWAVSVYMSYFV